MAEHKTKRKTDSHEQEEHHEEHHIVPVWQYLIVFGILLVGTVLTVIVAQTDLDWVFPGANTLVALGIALFKMSAVVLWFMHVRWSSRLIWLTAIAGFFWLAIMFAFTMQDYLTRGSGTF